MMRRALLAAALGLTVGACAAHEPSWAPPVARTGLVQLEIYDRTSGSQLAVHAKDGRRYIVGTPGHEYALRIRNTTGARVLAVTSVDGVNVISGDTAAPSQSGYVLEPWGSVEIIGWRKSLERTAAFYFTEHQNSYAARTGRPNDVGVIGVALFRRKVTTPPAPIGEIAPQRWQPVRVLCPGPVVALRFPAQPARGGNRRDSESAVLFRGRPPRRSRPHCPGARYARRTNSGAR
jgi:hypothetical protein